MQDIHSYTVISDASEPLYFPPTFTPHHHFPLVSKLHLLPPPLTSPLITTLLYPHLLPHFLLSPPNTNLSPHRWRAKVGEPIIRWPGGQMLDIVVQDGISEKEL